MLSRSQLENIADKLRGHSRTLDEVLYELYFEDEEDVEDQLLNINVEKCPMCDNWFDSFDINPDTGNCRECDPFIKGLTI